jgi:sugar-specific transcriptional regulator TrmB
MSIQKFLSSIGLDEKSQKIYLALLKLTDASASIIAKKAELERTTTHHHLEHLVKLGLVSTYRHKNIKRFVAENPNKIRGIFEGKISLLEKYLPELQKISFEERTISLRLFEGIDGMRQIIEEELNCKEKLVRSIGSLRDLRKVIGGKISFTKRRLDKKVFSKCLRPQDDNFKRGWIENQVKELREVRLLPEELTIYGMLFIFDNKVTVITPNEEGVGFIITNESLSKTMKSIFDTIWEISKKTLHV